MTTPPGHPRDLLLRATVAAAPDLASGDAVARVLASATEAAAAKRGGDCADVPRGDVLGVMADAIGELSMQTGARLPDVAYVTLCAAVVAARVADIDMGMFAAQLRRLYAADMRRPSCP